MLRQYILRLSVLIPLIGGLLGIGLSVLPTATAFACLPCNCKTYRSVNCFGPYALYTPSDSKGCSIDLFYIENGQGKRAFIQTPADLAKLPDQPDSNLLVKSAKNGFIALYKLTTGEYQVNVGPDAEGKVYVINFTGCPASDVYESNFDTSQ